ncbi:MAG: FliM/FliN family flagellar motor switch protein [Alphaproteobacteria bacterium]
MSQNTSKLPEHPEGLAQSLEELAAAFGAVREDAKKDGSPSDASGTVPLVKLGRGAVVPLDRRVGEPVDVVVNGRVVARGEVVVLDEDSSRFGISLTEVIGTPGM